MTKQTDIQQLIDAMTVEEMKSRLADYMAADERYAVRPIGVEVRMRDTIERSGRYEVLLLMSDGSEREVKFRDRYSRIIYIYTLMHPEGYHRRTLAANGYRILAQLYSKVYYRSTDRLLATIGDNYDQFFSQAVAQSRVAIRNTSPYASDFAIAQPQQHSGKTLIPFAKNKENVIIDSSLT